MVLWQALYIVFAVLKEVNRFDWESCQLNHFLECLQIGTPSALWHVCSGLLFLNGGGG